MDTQDHRQWDTFFDFLDDYPIAEYVPVQIVPGNHDIDKYKQGKDIFLAYEHRFRMPRVKAPELGLYEGPFADEALDMERPPYPLPYEWGNAYYAYSYGPARFIMISSYSAMEPGSKQYNWILQELEAVDRYVTPWLVAVLHTPLCMYGVVAFFLQSSSVVKSRMLTKQCLLFLYKQTTHLPYIGTIRKSSLPNCTWNPSLPSTTLTWYSLGTFTPT